MEKKNSVILPDLWYIWYMKTYEITHEFLFLQNLHIKMFINN